MNVKSKEAYLQHERTKGSILGGDYMSKVLDILIGKYFIEISNVEMDTWIPL